MERSQEMTEQEFDKLEWQFSRHLQIKTKIIGGNE